MPAIKLKLVVFPTPLRQDSHSLARCHLGYHLVDHLLVVAVTSPEFLALYSAPKYSLLK